MRSPDGVVFVRGVIPGERIAIGRTTRKRGVLWAESRAIVEPSPDRIEPLCPYASECGGCDFHHVRYERERREKARTARETLRRIAGRELPVSDDVATAEPLGYRNTIRIQGGAGYLGYCRKESNEIVDIEDCLIAAEPVRAEIRRRRARSAGRPPKSLTIRCGSEPGDVCAIETAHGMMRASRTGVTIRFLGRDYRVSAHSFFQVNVAVAEMIAAAMIERLPAGPRLFDLFAGVGTFALALAGRYERVVGFEISKGAVADFRVNASDAANVEVREWDAARGLKEKILPSDVVILDPPRTGLPSKLAAALARSSPAAMAYVSCDAATFARDARLLLDAGFSLDGEIRLFDMFPRTAHVELFAVLRRS